MAHRCCDPRIRITNYRYTLRLENNNSFDVDFIGGGAVPLPVFFLPSYSVRERMASLFHRLFDSSYIFLKFFVDGYALLYRVAGIEHSGVGA